MRANVKSLLTLTAALLLLASCRGASGPDAGNTGRQAPDNTPTAAAPTPAPGKAQLKVTSSAFQEGGMIPARYTCDGANVSPPLAWESVPEGTKSLALVAEDPDAPDKTWSHWVVFGIPAGARELPENVPAQTSVQGVGRQGKNDFNRVGYGGPCPPSGMHRYYFKLYALDADIALDPDATRKQLLEDIKEHVLAEGQLMGKYGK